MDEPMQTSEARLSPLILENDLHTLNKKVSVDVDDLAVV